MGEIKSVKVDNWGVFFLQKLQNFFNKTDYCDLTLQFFDNSQLKVHRLVLSACTDYFNVLEQTCEVIDDALIMPSELQADVVVPIVNFMYTGTLEFELKMYGKLLKTAKEMNMTVLLRLLEAHRRTMESVSRQQRPPSPKSTVRNRRGPMGTTATATQYGGNQQMQQRRILTTPNATLQQQQRRVIQTKNTASNASTSSATLTQQLQFRQQIGSTSLLKTSAGNNSQIKAQYGNITVYESTPQIKNEPEEYVPTTSKPQQNQATSPFEQLRKGYNNNKRPAVSTFISPPAKKPNIEDVKEFAEQQRMRKQIAAEYGDPDPCEYESMLDDDIHNYDDDDDGGAGVTTTSTNSTAVQASTSRQHQQQGSTTITFKQEQNDKPPTIVVKDSSNSKMNHAKIISEVLRQYPHLVKSNKNIKLKIMPNVGGQTQKIIVKKDQLDNMGTTDAGASGQQQQHQKPQVSSQIIFKSSDKAQQQQQHSQTIITKLPTVQKPIAATVAAAATATTATQAAGSQVQKRRIDSKTMHLLIALGAENTTGPWLCLRCGVNGRPISIPSYRGFRRHLINTHKESIDAALCEQCGWRSKSNRELHYHMLMEHKVKTTLYTFPECLMCAEVFLDTNTLNQHMVNSHPEEKQQCIYCNKIFARELQLYTHMKTYHKLQALDDGIIDYSDEEFTTHDEEQQQRQLQQQQMQNIVKDKKDTKIKILSDISLPSASSLIKLEPSSEAAALSTVASGIATSIGITSTTGEEFMETSSENVAGEPKFVNVDGNEMMLTDEQRKEILSQLNQEHGSGGVVMVLNEPSEFPSEAANPVEDDDLHEGSAAEGDAEADVAVTAAIADKNNEIGGSADGTSDFDDSQIYNEFNEGANDAAATVDAAIAAAVDDEEMCEVKKNTSNLEESKESVDNLEWAENLISAHELADEVAVHSSKTDVSEQQKAQKEDDISKKLKELTGDWSEDDNDDDDEHEEEDAEHGANAEANTETAVEATKAQINDEEETEGEEAEEAVEGADAPSDANLTTEPIEMKEKAQKEQQQEETSDNEDILQSVLNAAATADIINEPKMDEDDIDDAMKSLHKENDTEDDKEKTKENQKDTAETETTPSTDETVDKMDVDDVDTDADDESANGKGKNIGDNEHAEEKESNDESKIKESTNKSRISSLDEKENISSIATLGDDGKAILTELIDFVKEEEEFIAEDPSASTKEKIALDKLDDEKTEELKEIASAQTKEVTVNVSVDEIKTDADIMAAAAAPISADAIKKEEEKNIDVVTTTAAASSTSTSKTEDKVKSLISEWGDDEDEDDDEVGDGNDNKDDDDDL